jgi:hypothetical protein
MLLKQLSKFFLIFLLFTFGLTGIGNATSLQYDFIIGSYQGLAGNPYGINIGSTVTVDVNFDGTQGWKEPILPSSPILSSHSLSTVTGPDGEYTYDSTFTLSLSFDTSTIEYSHTDDVGYSAPDYATPIVTFNTNSSTDPLAWTFNTIDFYVEDTARNSWIYIEVPQKNDPIVLELGASDGSWKASSIPEPATIALFGLGLLGFAGISRKSKK